MVISGFDHRTGAHCGSTSLRDLADFYGWGVDEPACFGLGAGLGFTFARADESPRRMFVGRTPRLEPAFLDTLGVEYDEREGDDWPTAWGCLRDAVDAGRPVLAFVDLYHLDYYDSSTHFAPHAVLAVGYGDGEVVLADSEFADYQRISTEAFRAAWNPDRGFWGPLRNRRVVVTDPDPSRDMAAATREALRRNARWLLDPETDARGHHGVAGVRELAADLPSWADLPDASWCARFAYQNVERRGTGGGAFRGLYAPFVERAVETTDLDPEFADRMADVAADWTAFGETLREASEADDGERAAVFVRASRKAGALADAEERYFEDLLAAMT